jgi:hypothetical protein
VWGCRVREFNPPVHQLKPLSLSLFLSHLLFSVPQPQTHNEYRRMSARKEIMVRFFFFFTETDIGRSWAEIVIRATDRQT